MDKPAWYHNIAAHLYRVSIEPDGRTHVVTVAELHGPQFERAGQQIVAANDRFARYQEKADRQLPGIRLTARS